MYWCLHICVFIHVCMHVCMHSCIHVSMCVCVCFIMYISSLSTVVGFSQFLTVFWMQSHWPCVFIIFAWDTDFIKKKSWNCVKKSDSRFESVPTLWEITYPGIVSMDVGFAWWSFATSSWIWWNGYTTAHCRLHHLLKCSAHRNQVRI